MSYGVKDLKNDLGEVTFADLLLTFRQSQGLSQAELANMLDISRQNVCDLEKGRRIPSPERAAKIAKQQKEMVQYYVQIALQDAVRKAKLNYSVTLTKKKAS